MNSIIVKRNLERASTKSR